MGKRLRARHYFLLFLFAIVTLETTAITIDRIFGERNLTAFEVESSMPNHEFVKRFAAADANVKSTPLAPAIGATRPSAPAAPATAARPSAEQVRMTIVDRDTTTTGTNHAYIVKQGDTLSSIASLFGTNAKTLASQNALGGQNVLRAGQTLQVPVAAGNLTYAVKSGDSLSRIASRFNVPLQDLISMNDLASHRLTEGQKLLLPIRVSNSKDLTKVASVNAPDRAKLVIASPLVTSPAPTTTAAAANNSVPARNQATIVQVPSLVIVKTNGTTPAERTLTIAKNPNEPTAPAKAPAVKAPATVTVPAPTPVAPATPAPTPTATPKAAIKPVPAVAPAVRAVLPAPAAATKTEMTTKTTAQPQQAPRVQPAAVSTSTDDQKLITHVVAGGENLSTIARRYRTTPQQIAAANNGNTALKVGTKITVPVSSRYYRVLQVTSRRNNERGPGFMMPVSGNVTDSYGWRMHPVRRRKLFHAGVDFAAPQGTPILAAGSGVVYYAGWMRGYGRLLVIRHENGLSTVYGHCSKLRVRQGQRVRGGQLIGNVGSTGVSTGPHLHFEVRVNGRAYNPMSYLGR